ncbi:uncharacterized protein LOC128739688 [Sabethes cyaneus]|uniref:uncharacterized protein LOC128739688 n=1 Tax=Sabethes cyaneus TaxID=53552 RepID=UPI00237DCFB9|nr:uncharacterized protein LOC128739688 [Sabethes cyaneus]
MGAPSDPVTTSSCSSVNFTNNACLSDCCHLSRPGPVHGGLEGVSQPALPGNLVPSTSPYNKQLVDPNRNESPLRPTLQPGRTVDSTMEAPGPPNPVELIAACAHHSRPGPAVGCGMGVFQSVASGEYPCNPSNELPVFSPEYEVFRCDRGPRNSRKLMGGGVLVAVNQRLKAKLIENDQWSSIEQVWVCIEFTNCRLFLCEIYIPPDRVRDEGLIDVHSRSVMTVIDLATATDELIIIGDFNLPGLLWQPSSNGFLHPDPDHSVVHSAALRLLDCYSSAILRQINHVTNENIRCLDLCFTSAQDVAPVISLAPSPLVKQVRHHPPLVLTLSNHHSNLTKTIPSVSYDFRNADHRSIAEFFATINWFDVLDENDADNAALTLSHIIVHAIDRHVPKVVHSSNSKPWLTRELRMLKTEKRAALRIYSKFRNRSLRDQYIKLNTVYKRTSRTCFRRHLQRIQRNLKVKPKTFWKYVSDQRKESGLPSTMMLNGQVASEPQYVCQLFADKFARTFSDEIIPDDQISQAACNVPLVTMNTLCTLNIDEEMISRAASTLKSSTKSGPDVFKQERIRRFNNASLLQNEDNNNT